MALFLDTRFLKDRLNDWFHHFKNVLNLKEPGLRNKVNSLCFNSIFMTFFHILLHILFFVRKGREKSCVSYDCCPHFPSIIGWKLYPLEGNDLVSDLVCYFLIVCPILNSVSFNSFVGKLRIMIVTLPFAIKQLLCSYAFHPMPGTF